MGRSRGPSAAQRAAILLTPLGGHGCLAQRLHPAPPVSLEDRVVAHFGRSMFELYFRDYSGASGNRFAVTSARSGWPSASRGCRSAPLQAPGAVAAAPRCRRSWTGFLYPRLGIGRIAERLREEIERSGEVLTDARVERVHHDGRRIVGITARRGEGMLDFSGTEFFSTIPLTRLVQALQPHAPAEYARRRADALSRSS